MLKTVVPLNIFVETVILFRDRAYTTGFLNRIEKKHQKNSIYLK